MVKCSVCGRTICTNYKWPSSKGLACVRRHYKRYHKGFKRPATKNKRYKTRSKARSKRPRTRRKLTSSMKDEIHDMVIEILSDEDLI